MVYVANTPNGSTRIVMTGGRQQIPVFLQVDPVQYVKVTEIIIFISFAVTDVTRPLTLQLPGDVYTNVHVTTQIQGVVLLKE